MRPNELYDPKNATHRWLARMFQRLEPVRFHRFDFEYVGMYCESNMAKSSRYDFTHSLLYGGVRVMAVISPKLDTIVMLEENGRSVLFDLAGIR